MFESSIFSPCLFSEAHDKIELKEKQSEPGKLECVTFIVQGGHFISISNKCLKRSKEIYRAKDDNGFSLQTDCDGICLLEKNGKKYLLLIELKLGFSEVVNKATKQIAASYIKVKGLLKQIGDIKTDDVQELGIIVSYPYSPNEVTGVGTAPSQMKTNFMDPEQRKTAERYRRELIKNQETRLYATDFKMQHLCVPTDMQLNGLLVRHIAVGKEKTKEAVSLDNLI